MQLTGTADTARQASEDRAAEIARHRTGGARVVRDTVRTVCEAWFERQVAKGRSPSTLDHYREHLDIYVYPVIGDVTMKELRLRHVELVLAQVPVIGASRRDAAAAERRERSERRREERARQAAAREAERAALGRKKPGPKPRAAAAAGAMPARPAYRPVTWETQTRRVFATLRTALNSAVRRDELVRNPCDQVEGMATGRASKVDLGWTLAQISEFLRLIEGDPLEPLFALALMTGLRRGELCGLRWDDVDLDAGILTVRQQHVVVRHQIHTRPAKTRAGQYRQVDLDAGTVAMLRALRAQQRRHKLEFGKAWIENGLVFTWENGNGRHPGGVTQRFNALCEQLGLPHIRLHDLRHASASLGAATGEKIEAVSARLGHATLAVTSDLYLHLFRETTSQSATDRAALARGSSTAS